MRALLDTHAFLWFIAGSGRLSANARRCIADSENDLFLSLASLWEIAIKVSLGRLELLRPFDQLIPEQLEENSIAVLPIDVRHLSKMIHLPFPHRDPFDRLIIAQSIVEDFPVISSDPAFSQYPVRLIW